MNQVALSDKTKPVRSRERILLVVLFTVHLIINGYLVVIHEPWRDEVHAWLITQYMSVPEMIAFSRYEAHPILWNLILLPFAKTGAPIWTMNVISYICVSISAGLFVFKTKVHTLAKILILFTVPFVYTYSSLARNYCLILLLGMIISVLYSKRLEHPIIYSICVSMLVFTHSMAWGFVAGITITFHIKEIIAKVFKKSLLERKNFCSVCIGFGLIVLSTVFAVITLYGKRSAVLSVFQSENTDNVILSMLLLLLMCFIYLLFTKGRMWKEALIIGTSFLFMIVIYKTVYSAVIFQRLILIPVYSLLVLIIIFSEYKDLSKINKTCIYFIFLCSIIFNGCMVQTFKNIKEDISREYSSAREMARYINQNLPDEETILVDTGIMSQTIVPYTDKTLFDIRYEARIVDSLYHVIETDEIIQKVLDIPNHSEYNGMYFITVYNYQNSAFEEIYRTSKSISGENFILYRIKLQQD
ncbi:MAG: hypothetical protein J5623_03265 [Clostridiales bacterium]|nr:hypothetical protein [Clostridiales bacterium]